MLRPIGKGFKRMRKSAFIFTLTSLLQCGAALRVVSSASNKRSHGRSANSMNMSVEAEEVCPDRGVYWDKPLLRGEFHRAGAFLYPPFLGLPLFLRASTPAFKVATLIFSSAVTGIMTVSAALHTFPWKEHKWHQRARKADFAMIFVGIALFYSSMGRVLFGSTKIFSAIIEPLVWLCASVGVLTKWFVPDSPPWVNAVIFLTQGWACAPLVPTLFRTASLGEAMGLVMGGVFITLGAAAYSFQWPNSRRHKDVFGPHEMFHVGTMCMFLSFWFTMWMGVTAS